MFGIILIYFVLSLLTNLVDLKDTFIFFTINQLFEPLKITPQNLGITELMFGFIALQVSLSMKVGIYTKIILRIVDMITLLIMLALHKTIQILLYQNKNSLI